MPNVKAIADQLLESPEGGKDTLATARDPKTAPETLAQLTADADFAVRREVASNPRTSPKDLVKLLQDKDRRVSAAVERNPNLPVKYRASSLGTPLHQRALTRALGEAEAAKE